MKVTKKDLLPPNIIIPENWDKKPIKFLDFLDKTLTGRQYSYAQTKLDGDIFDIEIADLPGESFKKKIGEIKVEKRPDGLYLIDLISSQINIYNKGLYSACMGEMRGDDVINCSFQYLYYPAEVNTQSELDAFLRDEKLKLVFDN
jgi:hypothetical protein